MALKWKDYLLDNAAIDEISDSVRVYMKKCGEDSRSIKRVCLTIEELLLRIRDNSDLPKEFREPRELRFGIGKQLGRPVVKITFPGESYDPTDVASQRSPILQSLGLAPTWGYSRGLNTVSLGLSHKSSKGTLFRIIIAVVLAVGLGIAGKFIPVNFKSAADALFIEPVMNCFFGLLSTFAGFMIALTIMGGVMGVGDSAALSRVGGKTILRYLILGAMISFVTVFAVVPVFNVATGASGGDGSSQVKQIVDMVFGIFPSNPVEPFMKGNTIQIIVIGLFVGAGLLVVGEKANNLKQILSEASILAQWLMSAVCSLVPIYVFVALLHQIWGGGAKTLLTLWRPILVSVLSGFVWVVLMTVYTAIVVRCSPLLLVRKCFPALMMSFTTSSSMASFADAVDTCENKLGVEPSFVKFSYPVGNVVFKGATMAHFVVLAVFFAEMYEVKVNIIWLLMAAFVSFLLAVAVPPFAGTGVMVFTVLFAQLGIPSEAILMATAIDIIADFPESGMNVYMTMLEVVRNAKKTGNIDLKVLRGK